MAGKSKQLDHGIHSQESKNNECLWLLSTFSPLTQSRIPSREWCHPQWVGFPPSITVIETTLRMHIRMLIAQMILPHSNRVAVDSNPPRVYGLFLRHRAFFLKASCKRSRVKKGRFYGPWDMTSSFQTDHMKIIAPFDPSTGIRIQNFVGLRVCLSITVHKWVCCSYPDTSPTWSVDWMALEYPHCLSWPYYNLLLYLLKFLTFQMLQNSVSPLPLFSPVLFLNSVILQAVW